MSRSRLIKAAREAARELRRLRRAATAWTDPSLWIAAESLLLAAVSWGAGARERTATVKLRPRFGRPPAWLTTPPRWSTYLHDLSWWASRYAWDRAEGLPVEESDKGLLYPAILGPARPSRGNGSEGVATGHAPAGE